jgi:uncharacterized membrane protein YjgN (DUF898 family)
MQKEKLIFSGKGGDLFVIALKNILLSILTLGIYSFWAKVNNLKFFYKNTKIYKETFDYHGTGKEAFIGFLKGMLIVGVVVILFAGFNILLTSLFGEIGTGIAIVFLYLGIIAVQPMLILGKMRYQYGRTSWSNIRFSFRADSKEFYILFIKGALLTIITFGIYMPWFLVAQERFVCKNLKIGKRNFKFNGLGGEYFKILILGYLLSIITLGIYSFWWRASLKNYFWKNLEFGSIKFKSTLTGGKIFVNDITVLLMIVCTFGIAFPWAAIKSLKLDLDNLELTGDPKIEEIIGDIDKGASAIADGISEAADAIQQIGDVFV